MSDTGKRRFASPSCEGRARDTPGTGDIPMGKRNLLGVVGLGRMGGPLAQRLADMIDVFNVSTAYSYASRHRFPSNILNGSWNAQARVYNPWKDIGIAVRLARKCGADVELGETTFAFLEKAVARGMVEQDYSLLYRDFEKIRKIGLET